MSASSRVFAVSMFGPFRLSPRITDAFVVCSMCGYFYWTGSWGDARTVYASTSWYLTCNTGFYLRPGTSAYGTCTGGKTCSYDPNQAYQGTSRRWDAGCLMHLYSALLLAAYSAHGRNVIDPWTYHCWHRFLQEAAPTCAPISIQGTCDAGSADCLTALVCIIRTIIAKRVLLDLMMSAQTQPSSSALPCHLQLMHVVLQVHLVRLLHLPAGSACVDGLSRALLTSVVLSSPTPSSPLQLVRLQLPQRHLRRVLPTRRRQRHQPTLRDGHGHLRLDVRQGVLRGSRVPHVPGRRQLVRRRHQLRRVRGQRGARQRAARQAVG